MPSRPQDPSQFQTWANDVSARLRAIERRILQKDEIDVLQTFEDGTPLGDTLNINFSTGVRATLVGDKYVEVTSAEAAEVPSHIQAYRNVDVGDPLVTVPTGFAATTISFLHAVVNGPDWTWDIAQPTRVVYQGTERKRSILQCNVNLSSGAGTTERMRLAVRSSVTGLVADDFQTLSPVNMNTLRVTLVRRLNVGEYYTIEVDQQTGADLSVSLASLTFDNLPWDAVETSDTTLP